MALQPEDQIEDVLSDAIGDCLRSLNKIHSWNKAKSKIFDSFLELSIKENYFCFQGDFRDYHLQRKGQHCLYFVPINQRGALKVFAGKKIRLVCAGRLQPSEIRIFHAQVISRD